MLFATWLVSARRLAPSSVSVYLAAVRSLNIDRGFPDPMVSTPRLHRLIRGIKRSAAPSRLSRLPITAPLLSVIHRSLALDLFDHRMFWRRAVWPSLAFSVSPNLHVPQRSIPVPT